MIFHRQIDIAMSMIICKNYWTLICDLSWEYGSPAYSNDKEIRKLPDWLRQEKLPFISDFDNTRMEGYLWGNHYLYKFEWKPGDSIDHLYVYRAKRVNMHKKKLNEQRTLMKKLSSNRRRGI